MMNYASSIKHCELDNVKSRKSNIQTAPAQQRELQGTPRATSHRISHPMPATSGSAVRSLLNHPTSLARRALLLSVFLLSFGSVWGEEVALTTGTDNGCLTISADQFSGINANSILRIYESADAEVYIATNWNWIPLFTSNGHILQGSTYYNSTKKCLELTIGSELANFTNNGGIRVQGAGNQTISSITIETPAAVVDPFFTDVPSTVATETDYSEELARTVTNGTFTLSGVNNLSGVTYARIFITDASDGELSDQSPLNVTYNSSAAPAAGNNATAVTKNGVYIYDGGNALTLANVSVTLTPATGKKLTDYKVVCLLSTGSMTGTTGSLTEPTCELKYTYLFQYEPLQVIPITLPNKISHSDAENNGITFSINQEVKERVFNNNVEGKHWYTRWKLENNAGQQQPLIGNYGPTPDNFVFSPNYGTVSDNSAFKNDNNNTASWNFSNLGTAQYYAPTGKKLNEYAGWRFVCETSDSYDGVNEEPTHIFYIPIPSPITFEYDGTPTNTDVVQTLDSRTSTTSVTLDWTNTKVTPTITTTGYKYARFYVVDGTGTAVSPTDDTHKLTVTGGTLCTIGESGYYVYDGGSDITLPTVTLSSTGDVRDYKVVCWLATTLANINPNDGTTPIVEEPDIDVAYTFSFKKPSVTSTVDKTANITWNATSMTMDATAGAPDDWDTSWADLSLAQYVKWYVVGADGTTKEPLELGTSRQADKWTIGLSSPFSVSDNVAVLTGQTTFTATNWNTWGKPAVYAPSNKAYADVYNYKVICEVSEEASATATPNVRYTFSFTKDFLGSNKSGITTSTQREVLANATDMTCTLSEVTLPAGTKYARFYLLDGSDNIVAPTDKLTVTGSKGITVSGYENYGLYIYNESGISSAPTVTLTLETAELNLYRVVMVTSTDKAVLDASDNVISEPDYDTRKTWTFKYPTAHAEGTGEVEWIPVSMAVTPTIDALKGAGYLEGLGTNYHIVWTVENAGSPVELATGTGRQAGKWTVSRDGVNATFYAPTGQTFADVKDLKLVARLYETATGEDDSDKALTYTVSIIKTVFLGTEKPGCEDRNETVEEIEEDATSVTVPLGNALTAFGATAKYARIWLTKDDVVVDPTGKLSLDGLTAFTNSAAQYSYYITNASGITLSDITLTAESGVKFTQYKVHVALSADEAVGTANYAPRRVESLTSYEPDYDLLYTFDFSYAAKGKVIHKYIKADDVQSKSIEISQAEFLANLGKSALTDLNDNFYMKWFVLDPSDNPNEIWCKGYYGVSSEKVNLAFTSSNNDGYPFKVSDNYIYLYPAQLTANGTTFSSAFTTNKLNNPTVWVPQSHTYSEYDGYQIVCVTSASSPTVSGSTVTDPDENSLVTYIFHINATGTDPFIGNEKSSIQSASEAIEVSSGTSSKSGIDLTTNKKVKAMTDDGFVPKYVRWQVFDADDNLVDGVLTVSGTTTKVDGLGEYIYNGTGTTDLLKGLSIDVSGQTDTDLTHYRIIGLLSDCSADDNLVLNGTKVKEEPDFDLKVTVTFETAFRGKLTATAVEREVVFTQLASEWDYNTSGQEEFMLKISDDGKTVALQSMSGTTLIEKPLDILADLKTATGNTYTSLNSMENIYVRWYLERKDGSSTFVKGAVRMHNSSSTHFLPSNNTAGANLAHGFYWYKNGTTLSYTGGTPEGAVMVKFVQKGSDGPNPSINITDYNLVLNVSTHPYSEYESSYTNADHTINHEPDDLDIRYVFNFKEKDFPAENLDDPNLKVIYKNALYNSSTGEVSPVLFSDTGKGFLIDAGCTENQIKTKGYARWYIAEKATGNIVSGIGTDFTFDNAYGLYNLQTPYGWYSSPINRNGSIIEFDGKFTLPENLRANYHDYVVVCLLSKDIDNGGSYTVESFRNKVTVEPLMDVKYVYNLILTESEFANLPFVHYKGQSGRDWTKPEGSNGSMEQKVWDSSTGEPVDFTGDIRQGVHTWEYNLYILPSEERKLLLPFEKYETISNSLEPRGYIRWYDWKGDTKVVNGTDYTFTAVGTELKETDRGLFGLCLSGSPTHDNVGVTFTPTASFSETIDIACDVSKYSDGITTIGGTSYLIHEPTLSNRYIFHIHPASEMANSLAASKKTLTDAETIIKTGATDAEMHTKFVAQQNTMFNLLEDRGKMVVSLKDDLTGKFALRFDSHNLKNYILNAGTTETPNYVSADKVQWYAYYETADGIYVKKIGNTETNRITTFEYSQFTSNTYTNLKGEGSLTVSDGKKFHVVGYVGNGDFNVMQGTGTYAPVAHYELHFMAAPAIPLKDLKTAALNRTEEYMTYHYQLAGLVDFDGNPETDSRVTEATKDEYYSTENWDDAPTSSANNMTWMPREWSDIQYGFSYPQLTSTIKNGMDTGVSPEHGDYIMLKSMNASGISSQMNTPPHNFYWWKDSELYDYTHTYTDASKYGSFLYTDASDESRSIATIPFTGSLCSGSTLYFTAAVADMTSQSIKPQLVIRISSVDEHGNRTPLVAFHTCDVSTTGAISGEWNQVYGQSTVPVSFDNSTTSYVAEVINYANDTNGADFAIDQIAIYISTAKVKAETTSTLCDDTNKVKVKITADAENLINTVGVGNKVNLYYRLFERNEDGNHLIREKEALIGEGVYSDAAGAPKGYGVVADFKADLADLQTTATSLPAGQTSGFYLSEETGTVVFQLAEREFVLDPSKIYFVSIYTIGADKPGDTVAEGAEAAGWGNPYQGNQCTIYSNDINPQRIYMEFVEGENASDGTVEIGCGATEVNKTFDMVMKYPKTSGGHDDYEDIHFDYFLGSREDFKTIETSEHLKSALDNFRETYKDAYASSAALPSDYQTSNAEYYNVIKKYMDNGLLLLSASTSFSHTFSTSTAGELEFMAIPVEKQLTDGREVCSPIDICFTVKTGGGGPELVIGFDDVDYSDPDLTPAKRGVRMGLEQLTKLQTGGYKLHIPIHAYQDKNKGKTNKLFFSDGWLTVSETNDPTVELGKKIAQVVPSDAGSTDAYVNNNYMYLTLDFSGCEPTLHEGFYYEVSTMFYDESEKETAEADRCNSDLYMIFKIVPEFVTWESKPVTAPFYNANWNNDGNWQRSERAELYKGGTFGTQNTATAGHPNGYFNNLELNTNLNTHPGYVPMKFTYVTMPTDNHAPDLNGMTYEAVGSEQTGGKLINLANTLNTNTSPVGTHVYNSASTAGIRYDLLVRYGDHADGGEGCFGHRTYNGTTWIDGSTTGLPAKVFDCEKFDGNICREIYFKPGAELLQQQRLRYQKAWVEKELTANKWYLMSSPLKGTYAGDMYVPTTSTEATNGRQLTEAFQPISFSDTPSLWEGTGVGSGSYSRTKYPIYQRSWGLDQAKVYTKVNDIRATDYSAKLNFGTLSTNIVEWSHTYNDVQVPYSTLGGFSIRAHKKDQTTPALIRLPKDDVTYYYYEWNGTDHPEPAAGEGIKSTPKGADVLGQFVYDWTLTNADDVQVGLTLSDVQSQGADGDGNTYYLVGNPFMGSLDMGKFFAQNTAFGNTYYTYEGSVLTAVDVTAAPSETDKHIIKPLQGFFVKCAAGSADRVIFNRRMMTDGNWEIGTAVTSANPAPALIPALTLTTEGSKATIVLNEEAAAGYAANEDVETLFDSNLADVPMVYTVADGMAVSINQMPQIGMVPFGVVCNDNVNVNVNVNFNVNVNDNALRSTLNAQLSTLYVYDALTGESTEVGEDGTVTIQPNDYGRYYLTSSIAPSPWERAGGEALISVRGGQVTVTATDNLQQVRAVSISGATMYQAADCGTTCQFQLQPGTYVIEADSAAGRKTVKVFVR